MLGGKVRLWCWLWLVGVLVLMLVMASCGGDSSSGTVAPTTLSGAVVDGYVQNAQVTVYADVGMTRELASGVTDADGRFVLDVAGQDLPSTFYLKSRGGIDRDTGLPAPIMRFVGSYSADGIYVTPLTDMLYRYARIEGLDAARSRIAGRLGLSETDIYADPAAGQAPAAMQQALASALQTGTLDCVLPDGDYTLVLLYLESDDLGSTLYPDMAALLAANKLEGAVSISGGQVSGSLGTETVRGRISGSGLVLQIADDPANPTSFTSVSGQVGLLGSVTGTYYNLDLSRPGSVSRTDGLFVAALVPQSGLQPHAVAQAVGQLYGGDLVTLFQDVFGSDHDTGYGTIQFTGLDPLANQVSMSGNGFTVHFISGVSAGNSDSIQLLQGTFLQTSDDRPTGLLVLEMLDSTGDKAFFILPLGSRRGIYMAVDTDRTNSADASAQHQAYAIGHAFLSTDGPLVPRLKPSTTYRFSGVGFPPVVVGDTLSNVHSGWALEITQTVPLAGQVHAWDDFSGADIYFLPGVIGISGGNGFATTNGVGMMFEMYEGGGLVGQGGQGGCIDPTDGSWSDCDATHVLQLNLHPALLLARAVEDGVSPPAIVPGRFDYLERPVYASDQDLARLSALRSGSLTVTGVGSGQATLILDGVTLTLDVDSSGGLHHAAGSQNGEQVDIYWVSGVPRGLYLRSVPQAGTSELQVVETGEIFLSE